MRPERPLVLVVEDDRLTREMSSESIRAAGMRVIQCESGDAALELLSSQRPDLVLLDLAMPGLSGIETLREIRRERALRDLPVVVATGHGDLPTIQTAYQAGATDFVIKPIVYPILVARIRYILKSSAAFEKLDAARRSLEDAQRLLRSGSWEWSARRGRLWVSESLRSMLSLGYETSAPTSVVDLVRWVHPEERSSVSIRFQACFDSGAEALIDHRLLTAEGDVLHVRQQVARLVAEDGGVVGLQGVILDRTTEERASRQADLFEHYDAETGLPNRRLLLDRLDRAIDAAVRGGNRVALVCLELDRASHFRSSLDEATHRALLRAAAERLSASARDPSIASAAGRRPRTWIAHARDTRFAVVVSGFHEALEVCELAEQLRASLDEPFAIDALGGAIGSAVSAGIALSPGDGTRPGDLLRAAEAALDAAQARRGGALMRAAPERIEQVEEILIREADAYRAFRAGSAAIALAPIASLASGRVVGLMARALLPRPRNGPLAVIEPELARRAGWADALSRWLLAEAFDRSRDWHSSPLGALRLCVDVPASCIRRPDFVAALEAILGRAERAPASLEIGLGAIARAELDPGLVASIEALRALGVQVALDLCGADGEGLASAFELPCDALRIDRAGLGPRAGPACAQTGRITALATLGRARGVPLVATGVESLQDLRALRQCGVDQIEGPILGTHFDAIRIGADQARDLVSAVDSPSRSINAEED